MDDTNISPTILEYARSIDRYERAKKLSVDAQIEESQARAGMLFAKRAMDAEREELLRI